MRTISRFRTAIKRYNLSRPLRVALEDGIISQQTSVLDYGCGKGDDMRNLDARGVSCVGWDPESYPDGRLCGADVVNLGYVVNVIEDPNERAEILRSAWHYTQDTLIVSARLARENGSLNHTQYQDGIVTGLGTFQKFYEQSELREWIEGVLGEAVVAAAPGIFYIFRSEERRHLFVSSHYRRRLQVPKQRVSDTLFEQHKALLHSLMSFFTMRGRLPEDGELAEKDEIVQQLGSLRRAFAIIRRVTGPQQWLSIVQERKQDLLVYLALAMFPKPPKFTALPPALKFDVRAFLSTYRRACEEAQRLLFSVGDMKVVEAACRSASLGKLLPEALYVHVSGLSLLPVELRVIEGCARVLAGKIEGATLVKFSRHEPKISYLHYPQFDKVPHPELKASLRVELRGRKLRYREYSNAQNPPILHRKELFVASDYPLRERFVRLTQQEEKYALLDAAQTIGTRDQWFTLLSEKGLRLKGHRLVHIRNLHS